MVLLLLVALCFAANHVSARIAFDDGASVATGVLARSTGTALAVFLLLRLQRVPLGLSAPLLRRTAVVGVLLAVQSYSLYSAVARIPVALALLAFNTFPIMLALLAWWTGGGRPGRRALVAMPVAIAGLALALDVVGRAEHLAGRWAQIGEGVAWALLAAASFAGALLLTERWLKQLDGRVRSFVSMGIVALLVLVPGVATDAFALTQHAAGWTGLALLTIFYGTAITSVFVLLPRLGAVNNAVVLNFEPIALLGLGWVILGQAVSALQLVGACVVVGAIVYLGLGRR